MMVPHGATWFCRTGNAPVTSMMYLFSVAAEWWQCLTGTLARADRQQLTPTLKSTNLSPTAQKEIRVFSFKSKTRSDCLNALVMTPDGVASATVKQVKNGKPLLQRCAYDALAPGQEMAALLTKSVTGMGKAPCSTLLDSSDYQLLMVEAPEVPSSELKAAIRWRIRDLIDFHIDDAVLDVFDAPPSGARGVQEHLYTVVTRSALVKEKSRYAAKCRRTTGDN